jgi:protein-L-isoaspartate O-methyltransferase
MSRLVESYRGLEVTFGCDPEQLPPELRARFVDLSLGDEGRAYVDRAISSRPGRMRTQMHRTLIQFMSDFDANGMLDMYPMHLLGTEQWQQLLGRDPSRRHLDVGAGSGDVTARLAPLSGEIVTTETSWAMARVLRRRGFECVRADVSGGAVPRPPYDLITCLNVIDRCRRPKTLLAKLRDALAPEGRLVVATPLPFDPIVYDGPNVELPEEHLPLGEASWETSVATLIDEVLAPLGLAVEAISRAPYLSGGDARRELYTLDDAVIVCRRA